MPHSSLFARRIIAPVVLLTLTACGGGSGGDSSSPQSSKTTHSFTLQGNISDGPVVGATVIVLDASGIEIAQATSNDKAHYALTIPEETPLPLTLIATDGTDIVSGQAPTFTMKSVSFATEAATANINAHSTLAVQTARQMEGGLSERNVTRALNYVRHHLNFGMDEFVLPDPITTTLSDSNVASAVRSNEALAQMIKRAHSTLQQGGVNGGDLTQDELIASLAADLVDGVIDGRGAPAADPRSAAVATLTAASVLVQTLNNELQVNGRNATDAMDQAIKRVLPDSDARTTDAPATALMLEQTIIALTAAREVSDSTAIDQALEAVRNIDPDLRQSLSAAAIPTGLDTALKQAADALALALDNDLIKRVNDRVRENVEVPAEEPVKGNTPPEASCAAVAPIAIQGVEASAQQEGNPPEYVIDGDATDTRWAGGGETMPHWISLDLGRPHLVSRTRVSFFNHDQGRIYRYSVHGSLDGKTWLPVFERRNSESTQWTEADFASINARYVRITLEEANDSEAASIWELEVHGKAGAQDCPNRTVTVSWAANSDEVLGYRVYAGPSATDTAEKLRDLPVSSGSVDPTQPQVRFLPDENLLSAGENKCFRLRAYNAEGESDWSNAVCAGI